jgi:hypothetical protein
MGHRRMFTAMNAYTKRSERSQMNDLILQLKLLGKRRTRKPQNNQKERKNKKKGEINEIETNKQKNTKNQ